jgi:hypothetical protein
MRLIVFGLSACLAMGLIGLSPGLRADEKKKDQKTDQKKGDPEKEFKDIQKDFAEAQQAFIKAYQEAKTPEEKANVLKEKRPKPDEYADRFLKLAETYPDSPAATQAMAWLLSYGRGTEAAKKAIAKQKEKLNTITDLDQLQKTLASIPGSGMGDLAAGVAEKAKKNLDHPKALPILMWVLSQTLYSGNIPDQAKLYDSTVDLIMERWADKPEVAPLAQYLPQDTNPAWAEKHLRTLMEKNSSADVKLDAKFGLATVLKNKDEASQPEAEKLMESVIEDFSKNPAKKQMVEQIKKDLDDMKIRGIGKPVPDIAGADLDDKDFKLSDYKGKVVLIDFWGFW